MAIQKRNIPGNKTYDPNAMDINTYNDDSGAWKVAEVGKHLVPLATPGVGNGYTTNISAAPYPLPGAGKNLAVYNSSGTAGSITFGTDNTITALAAGATDANGHVGLPCPANSWSYFAGGYSNWAISSASTLYVFLINDESSIQVVSQNNAST